MQVKTVEIGSQSFKIAGLESGQYFQHLDLTNIASAGLCQLIMAGFEIGSVIFDVGANIGVAKVVRAQMSIPSSRELRRAPAYCKPFALIHCHPIACLGSAMATGRQSIVFSRPTFRI
jgi:hypothetical protein